jgi:hypothetical protein
LFPYCELFAKLIRKAFCSIFFPSMMSL